MSEIVDMLDIVEMLEIVKIVERVELVETVVNRRNGGNYEDSRNCGNDGFC